MDLIDFFSARLGGIILTTVIPVLFALIYFLAKTYKEIKENS